jgi:hypothetical protein
MGWRPGETTPVPKVMADLHTRLKETGTHGKPRILVREHGDNPSFSDFFPELLKLNKTVTRQGRGCRLSMFTILRDPVDRLISEMHWYNRNVHKVMTSADIRAYADSSQDFVIKFPLVRKYVYATCVCKRVHLNFLSPSLLQHVYLVPTYSIFIHILYSTGAPSSGRTRAGNTLNAKTGRLDRQRQKWSKRLRRCSRISISSAP